MGSEITEETVIIFLSETRNIPEKHVLFSNCCSSDSTSVKTQKQESETGKTSCSNHGVKTTLGKNGRIYHFIYKFRAIKAVEVVWHTIEFHVLTE